VALKSKHDFDLTAAIRDKQKGGRSRASEFRMPILES
jgi:hypothetical protein